ncbi:hypothetical protein [Chitinophaga sp. Ak27]|uniref:hypothetical protein n=1 Tax=Chitinophaga sp. Ak27 TaxID=2726116 RepID=UPI00145C7732|nr:hypothetical protein [Chitinophaga sp. Ak27]NLU93810.1 hypothetical protein [Chitinophaga sp. Ak27]
MKQLLNKFIIALIVLMASCQHQSKCALSNTLDSATITQTEKLYDMNIDTISSHMELQDHIEATEDGLPATYTYNEVDVDIAMPIIAKGLADQGYQTSTDTLFDKKVIDIFGNIFHMSNSKIKLHPHFTTVFQTDSSTDEFDYTIDNFFISREFKFITWVPLLGDIIIFTDKSHYKMDLHPKLVSLNKYLFNNSQPDLAYLLQEDSMLLKTLVTSFGYTKEPKINDLVMNDYLDMDDERKPTIGNIIFVKNALGVLEIKEELLKWIFSHTAAYDHQLLDALDKYANMLYDNRPDEIFTEQPHEVFTLNEKRKIVAYIAIIYEPLFHKFLGELNSNWPDFSVLERIIQKDPGLRDYIRQQHYFSLESLKKIIESSDYDL